MTIKVTGIKVGKEVERPNGNVEKVRAISVILHMENGDDDVFLVHPPVPDPEPSDADAG